MISVRFKTLHGNITRGVRVRLPLGAALLALGAAGVGEKATVQAFDPQAKTPLTLLPVAGIFEPAASNELLGPPRPGLVWAPPPRHLVRMEVSAYCPCPICCGPNACGITASGKYIDFNAGRFVAADPSVAFGTKLVVPGYVGAPVEVIDRGGAIRGNRLDVFFPTHEQAMQWGRKVLAVTIIK